jgi:hypothetical protein
MHINATSIKQMLESIPCPEHQKRAKVEIEVGKIEITACCENFRASLEQLANQEYVKAIDSSLHDVLENSRPDHSASI